MMENGTFRCNSNSSLYNRYHLYCYKRTRRVPRVQLWDLNPWAYWLQPWDVALKPSATTDSEYCHICSRLGQGDMLQEYTLLPLCPTLPILLPHNYLCGWSRSNVQRGAGEECYQGGLVVRACCREVKFSKTLAWVIFCCLFMWRIDIYLSWKNLIMFSWGEIGLKIWPVLKGKWLKIGLNWAYFKMCFLLIQKW